MFEVKITASPELVQSINNLAAALSGVRSQTANPIQGQTATPTSAPAAPMTAPAMGAPAPATAPSNFSGQTYTAPGASPASMVGSATPAPTSTSAAPMAGPTSTSAAPMAGPTSIPTAQTGTPAYQTGVPLAQPPQYTIDQIMAAGATLMDSGRVDDLVNLLHTFGVAAVTDLKPEQMGAFATALRGLGAKI